MYSVVVAAHPGVVMANHPLAVKLPSETYVLQARHTHRGFGAFSRKFQQPNHPQYLQLIQGGHSRAEPLFCVSQGNAGDNCFGEVVGNEMLKKLGSNESQENRARLALLFMNQDDKKGQASRYVANLKDQYGYGASTLCLVYNATGETLSYSTGDKHWLGGSIFKQEEYPKEIHNGQWAAFLHVHGKDEDGKPTASAGAVVYQITGDKSQDILLAWYTDPLPLKQPNKQTNKAYSEITPRLEKILDKLRGNVPSSTSGTSADGVEVEVQTEQGTNSPTFTAIIKRKMTADE